MIKQKEKDFVENFIAELFLKDKKTIPYDNDKFKAGLENVAEHFNNALLDTDLKEQLSLLFVKQTTYGEFRRIQEIIEDMNGTCISLVNPRFVNAIINMNIKYIDYIRKNDKTGLNPVFYSELADAFCEGAGI